LCNSTSVSILYFLETSLSVSILFTPPTAQQDILQSDVLKKLGALESSSRNSNLGGHKQRIIGIRMRQLRNSIDSHIANIKQTGLPSPNASIQFFASKEYEDLVFNTHKVANCSECALICCLQQKILF
jgi:hypothetical protein